MLQTLRQAGERLEAYGRDALAFVREPAALVEVAVLAACLALASLLDRLTRAPIERQARRIKGAPRILRIVAAIRRRMTLVFFVLLLWIARLADTVAGGPPSPLLAVVLNLALAYLVIAVASRIIRSRFLSRLITVGASGLAALSILDLTDPVSRALDAAAITVGTTRVSALLVLEAVTTLAFALWAASAVSHFVNGRLQHNEELTPRLRVLIGKLLRIVLVLVAIAAALAAVGVDLTAFTVLSGALGVGLGFGLQRVASNFISGLIILLDRSLKPGDTISLGDTFGWIRELRARFVSVVTRDGREYLIPNEDFITNQVINWSFTDDLVRIDVDFRVSYDCDPHAVTRIARDAASAVPRVVASNPVVCWITGFGESSLDFVLRFWISDPQAGLTNIKGQVLLALWDAFKANGIAIPYPRREVTLRGAPGGPGTGGD